MPIVDVPQLGRVEFPDGMSHEDMLTAIRAALRPSSLQRLVADKPWYERAAIGAGEAFNTLGRGAAQKGIEFLQHVGDVSPEQMAAFQQETAAQRELAAPVLATPAGLAGNLVGNVAAIAPIAMIPGANTVTGSALIGGLSGALMPTVGNESSLTNTALGAGFGGLGGAIGRGIGRLNAPVQARLSPEAQALAQRAQQAGIPLDAADLTGSRPLQAMRSTLENMPLVGSRAQADKAAKAAAFNRAVGETFGAQADALTPAAMAPAKSALSRGFQDVAARNLLSPDQQFINDLLALEAKAAKGYESKFREILRNQITEALDLIDPATGKIPGQAYRQLDTEIGKLMKGGGDKAYLLGQWRDILRGAMDRSISPEDQAAWRSLRRQWANMKTVEPLVAKNAEGNVSPRELLNKVATRDKSTAYLGGGDLGELGRIGKLFVAEPIPDSGTAQRSMWQRMLMGGMPDVAAGSLIGAGALGLTGDPTAAIAAGLGGAMGIPLAARAALRNPRWLSEGLLSEGAMLRHPYVMDALRSLPAALPAGLLGTLN